MRERAVLSQWQLIRLRFCKHKLAVAALVVLANLYLIALFAEFFAPYPADWKNVDHAFNPPQTPKLSFEHGLHVKRMERERHPITRRNDYVSVPENPIRIGFFVRGEPYRLWGLIPCERHFVGPLPDSEGGQPPPMYLLGADKYGQDILSRLIYGSRISLSIGLIAILVTGVIGIAVGGMSGYCGGRTDIVTQRGIEVISSVPELPLWLALAAAMPRDWPVLYVYFSITVVLSLIGWTGLARVVRGKILSLREEDYAVAARLLGANHSRILFKHLMPGFTSHIIVSFTLAIPGMILGETALSFLGLGLRPPVVSWGVMLQDTVHLQTVATAPWLLMPVFLIVFTVLAFTYVGDGLRDAADPYEG